MHTSIKSRFSSFEEDIRPYGRLPETAKISQCLFGNYFCYNVCEAQRSTSGACQPTWTRINTLGAGNGRSNVISLDNSLNDDFLGYRSPVEREFQDDEDI